MTAEGMTEVATAELNRAASSTMEVLRRVRAEQMAGPTPCASWDVHALINHFVGSARWMAALVAGKDEDPAADYAAGDYLAAYEESIRIAGAAFTAERIAEPDEPRARELLGRYMAAFENADAAELERLLVEDVTLEATPMRSWYAGRKTCVPFLRARARHARNLAPVRHPR